MFLPLQIIDEEDISRADSLFRTGLEHRVQSLAHMSWGQRVREIGGDLVHVSLKIAVAVVVVIIGRWLIRRLGRSLDRMLKKWKVDSSLHTFIRSVVKTVFYFVLFYMLIAWLGVNTSLFVALFAAAGLAIGMAMSGMFQNIAGGVMILVLKPFRCGEWIELEGQAGTVMDIRLFHTILRTADNRTILLPNGGVFTNVISNHSSARTRRLEWPLSLNLGSDFEAAQKVILELLATDKRINTHPAPEVVLNQITSDSIVIFAHAWVPTVDYWNVYFKFSALIYRTLTDRGFDMGTQTAIIVSKDETDQRSSASLSPASIPST